MKLETSNKTSVYGNKPHIKRGYYPGKLLSVKVFTDKEGNPKVGKYGEQLIFEFAIYKPDSETDVPVAPMKYMANETDEETSPVIISKFAYHKYKKSEKGKEWIEGEFQTAITPNSNITKVLVALGWTFSTDDVDPEKFIDTWAELNIVDYEVGEGDSKYTASTIDNVNEYKGPEVKDVENVESKKPADVKKQVKHEAVKDLTKEQNEEIKGLKKQIENLQNLHEDGNLTDQGLKQSVEQLESKIEAIEKK